ncbi:MAG: selenocysteine-specific translation elongation factor [Polyangiaceae bacterium]|nr:selenocysteine-specific translation elongation factor [Polyangiaceae bacterium]
MSAPGPAERAATPPRRFVVATAGHVDHGKTTLVRALTGTDTDRLPEEKRRGISIELGFAELPGTGISFIDVPGHRKLVHTMIAGMGGVELVVLVVAADDGVMPQTREHLAVASLLGLRRVLLVLSKTDLVDAETTALAELDAREAVAALGLEIVGVVATAAPSGAGVPEVAACLGELVSGAEARGDSARTWLAVDRVFTVRGTGTVVTGTLARGRLAVGDEVFLAGSSGLIASSCRGLEVHGRAVTSVVAPARVAVNLARLAISDAGRGDVLTRDPELPITSRIDVALRALPDAVGSLGDGAAVTLHLGTGRVGARVVRLGEGTAHLTLEHPIPCEGGVGFVVRGFTATRERGQVLGGGMVLDAGAERVPPASHAAARALRVASLEALRGGAVAEALEGLVRAVSPRALAAATLERRLGLEPGAVHRQLAGKRPRPTCVALGEGEGFAAAEGVARLVELAVERVVAHHRTAPEEAGLPLETLRSWLARRAGRDVGELCVRRAERERRLYVDTRAGVVATPVFLASASPAARALEARLGAALASVGLEGTLESRLASELGESEAGLQAALQRLSSAGRARRLGGLWFDELALDSLRARVGDHLARAARLSVADFKELAGVSRKQAIPLLEQLDREGTTRRQGDDRIVGAGRRR